MPKAIEKRHQIIAIAISLFLMFFAYPLLFKLFQHIFEHRTLSYLDSVFWTISTLTSLGEGPSYLQYRLAPLQILSIIVQLSGIGMISVLLTVIIIPYVSKKVVLKLPEKAPTDLEDHVIICGYSAMVESFVEMLRESNTPFIIIEENETTARELHNRGYPIVLGEAGREETLKNANIQDARIILANEEIEKNASIVLTVSPFKKEIIVVVEDITKAKYFKYAGAARVISPKQIFGGYISSKVIRHISGHEFETIESLKDLKIASFKVSPMSPLVGKKLKDTKIREMGCLVLEIRRRREIAINPPGETEIEKNSLIIAIGEGNQLDEMEALICGITP
jgi:voltage-gated potassium channel